MSLSTMKPNGVGVVGLLCPHLTVQNGVVDNKVRMEDRGAPSSAPGSGAKSFSLETENKRDDCPGDVDKVGTTRVSLPLRTGLGFDSGFHSSDDDGSLPTSPDSQPSSPAFPTEDTELHRKTRELILTFYRNYTGLSAPERKGHKAMRTMTKVVHEVLLKHGIVFKGMMKRLDPDHIDDGVSFVRDVAENTFSDGATNWGRIATLVAFGAALSEHLKVAGRPECVEAVANEISSYLAVQKCDWFLNNNGWHGFVDFFHVEDPEATVRNTLMAFAGLAGLGAGLAFLIR
ncbi:induced myeloid leukemia cell differentiation protein Mcl-1a [Sardina pilchardus]|uniref:induced myeloid leukemia cell differentiation protein Mcl-1a n=1 Tax=Sardina pilchardus TaxID=27697 RepID=UPI002E14D8AA